MKVVQFSSLYPIHCSHIPKITRDSDKLGYIISPDRKNCFGIIKETDQQVQNGLLYWGDIVQIS
jgi:hypothetical protein